MLAARSGAQRVVGCELFRPLGNLAREIVIANDLADRVKIFTVPSTQLKVLPEDSRDGYREESCSPERAEMLVTEIFDSVLLGEGIIPTLHDAADRLLVGNAHVIPQSAKIWAELIELDPELLLFDCGRVGNASSEDIVPGCGIKLSRG